MLELKAVAEFKRDRRRCIKRGCDMSLLEAAVGTLRIPAPLPAKNRDHTLKGEWAGHFHRLIYGPVHKAVDAFALSLGVGLYHSLAAFGHSYLKNVICNLYIAFNIDL